MPKDKECCPSRTLSLLFSPSNLVALSKESFAARYPAPASITAVRDTPSARSRPEVDLGLSAVRLARHVHVARLWSGLCAPGHLDDLCGDASGDHSLAPLGEATSHGRERDGRLAAAPVCVPVRISADRPLLSGPQHLGRGACSGPQFPVQVRAVGELAPQVHLGTEDVDAPLLIVHVHV